MQKQKKKILRIIQKIDFIVSLCHYGTRNQLCKVTRKSLCHQGFISGLYVYEFFRNNIQYRRNVSHFTLEVFFFKFMEFFLGHPRSIHLISIPWRQYGFLAMNQLSFAAGLTVSSIVSPSQPDPGCFLSLGGLFPLLTIRQCTSVLLKEK